MSKFRRGQNANEPRKGPECPYCKGPTVIRGPEFVYGDKAQKDWSPVWVCQNYPDCDAYVGCHPGGKIPLGTPARKALRLKRMRQKDRFNSIWMLKKEREEDKKSRTKAYTWLASELGIKKEYCHFGMFTEPRITKVSKILDAVYEINKSLRNYHQERTKKQ